MSVSVALDSKADVQLKTGGVAEQVTVVASGALLESTQSQVAKTVEQTRILELPGRSTLNGLALLNPGVLPNQNALPRSGFAVNGNRTRSNNFTIDGANNDDQSLSIPLGVNVSTTGQSGKALYVVANRPAPPSPQDYVSQGNNPNFLPLRLFSPNERVKQPMSWQWTVSTQYQLARDYVVKAEYIGTKGANLIREVESNVGFCGANNPLSATHVACSANALTAALNGARRDPTLGSVLIGQGVADSIYHAGQFTIEKGLSDLRLAGTNLGGLQFNANYTYSMFISTADDVLGGQANRTLPSDPREPVYALVRLLKILEKFKNLYKLQRPARSARTYFLFNERFFCDPTPPDSGTTIAPLGEAIRSMTVAAATTIVRRLRGGSLLARNRR